MGTDRGTEVNEWMKRRTLRNIEAAGLMVIALLGGYMAGNVHSETTEQGSGITCKPSTRPGNGLQQYCMDNGGQLVAYVDDSGTMWSKEQR